MKHTIFWSAIALVAALAVSCKKDVTTGTSSSLNISSPNLYVEYQGGTYSIPYTIENPVDGGQVTADLKDANTDWISNISVQTDAVSINVSENTSDQSREAVVVLTYRYPDGQSSKEVTVLQPAAGEVIEGIPSITVDPKSISATADGGNFEIAYTIENPVDGGEISASCPAPYVASLDCSTDGLVTFTVAVNDGDYRNTEISITYTWADGSTSVAVPVSQTGAAASDGNFTLQILEQTYSSVTCRVTPSESSMQHISMVIRQDKYPNYTDEQWFMADFNYFEQMAGQFGLSFVDYMNQFRINTGELEFTATGLDPEVDFYLYAYGIDSEAWRTTNTLTMNTAISKLPFRLEAPAAHDGEIVLEVEIFGGAGTIVATPYSNDVLYYVDWLSEKALAAGSGFGGTYPPETGSVEDRIYQYTYEWMSYYMTFGFTINNLGWYGPKSISFTISDPTDTYYAFAYLLNNDATMGSEMFLKTITDGSVVSSPARTDYVNRTIDSNRPVRPE